MIRVLLFITILLCLPQVRAQDETVHYADATQEKALVDEYLNNYSAEEQPLIPAIKLTQRLFNSYDREVYLETLRYLESFAETQPEAVLSLSDSLQTYWDSHYLRSYVSGTSAEYSKLKLLSALGMVGGGIGILKNPLTAFGILRHLNLLLPLAGGVGTYYAVNFFRKPSQDIPPEPQDVLSFAQGKRYFSYQQKRNDYLYRLFSVGAGIGTGQFAFHALANRGDEVHRILKPKLNKRYLKGAVGAVLAYFAVQQGGYYLLRKIETKKKEKYFRESLQMLYNAVSISDTAQTILAARELSEATTQLVTLYEMKHLHTMVEYEQHLSKDAAGSTDGMQENIERLTAQLSKSLQNVKYQRTVPEQDASSAKKELDEGKQHRSIVLLWQVAMVFKTLHAEAQVGFLQHFYHKMQAKFNNMHLMYENFSKIVEHNQLWQKKFTSADLQDVLPVYLDYHRADQEQAEAQARNDKSIEVLTSTRSFARFLAKEIVKQQNTKDFNNLILQILDTYQQQAQHRQALAVLVEDIQEQAELHDSYYNSIVADGVKGAFTGSFVLMGAAGLAGILERLGLDSDKRPMRWLAKLLSFENSRQWNFAGLPTSVKALKRLGVVGMAGAGIGVLWHYARQLRKHKLHPQASLLATQKLVAVELAYQTCQLQYDIEKSQKDKETLLNFNAAQIEAEREMLTNLSERFGDLAAQVNHLHRAAPSLRVNHLLDPQLEARISAMETEASCRVQEVAAVSITPITADLRDASSMLRQRKKILDEIDQQRYLQELGG